MLLKTSVSIIYKFNFLSFLTSFYSSVYLFIYLYIYSQIFTVSTWGATEIRNLQQHFSKILSRSFPGSKLKLEPFHPELQLELENHFTLSRRRLLLETMYQVERSKGGGGVCEGGRNRQNHNPDSIMGLLISRYLQCLRVCFGCMSVYFVINQKSFILNQDENCMQ